MRNGDVLLDLLTVRKNAADRLTRACHVCRQCNGVACAGQIPGFGGVGTGSSFIANVEALAKRKLNLRVLHDATRPDTRGSFFGVDLSMPILGAAVAGVRVNRMDGITELELAKAIISSDSRALEGIKGIGKKTAERMVLELKDKMGKFGSESNNFPMKNNTLHQDALNALTALGINRQAAGQAIEKVLATNSNIPVEDLVKTVLRTL